MGYDVDAITRVWILSIFLYIRYYELFMYSPCHIIQLALQKKVVMDFFFYVLNIVFPSSQSVYFGEITRVMRHICIFSRDIFSPPIFFLMLGGCFCRLPARIFIWLVVESISI